MYKLRAQKLKHAEAGLDSLWHSLPFVRVISVSNTRGISWDFYLQIADSP